jgi:nitroreductase
VDVSEAIAKRRSIRTYKNTPLEPKQVERLLEAARQAPSARNEQPWRVVVVTNPKIRKELQHACMEQSQVGEAPLVLCGCIGAPRSGEKSQYQFQIMDLTLAFSFASLQAVELGLGSCWIGDFNPKQVKNLLRIPESQTVVALLTVGYPHYSPPASTRKPHSQLFAREFYPQDWED